MQACTAYAMHACLLLLLLLLQFLFIAVPSCCPLPHNARTSNMHCEA
jgi:hypothetical protein